MKLFRFGAPGAEKPGLCIGQKRYDVSAFGEDYNEEFFQTDGLNRLQAFLAEKGAELPQLPEEGMRFGPPVARPSKIICIGLNYADHARESGATPPQEPILFFKSTTALCGPNDAVIIPKGAEKLDWEVELAVVIGKKASYVSEAEAPDYVAGYVLHNDYSERAFQLERGGQWVKGKSCDTFAPLGPYLVTPEQIGDVHNLRLWLKVNGRLMQDGTTADLIFNIPQLIAYTSQFMTLLPGDIISTGTPAGVGLGMKPPLYLKEDDVVELGIEGLGEARQQVVAFESAGV